MGPNPGPYSQENKKLKLKLKKEKLNCRRKIKDCVGISETLPFHRSLKPLCFSHVEPYPIIKNNNL